MLKFSVEKRKIIQWQSRVSLSSQPSLQGPAFPLCFCRKQDTNTFYVQLQHVNESIFPAKPVYPNRWSVSRCINKWQWLGWNTDQLLLTSSRYQIKNGSATPSNFLTLIIYKIWCNKAKQLLQIRSKKKSKNYDQITYQKWYTSILFHLGRQ